VRHLGYAFSSLLLFSATWVEPSESQTLPSEGPAESLRANVVRISSEGVEDSSRWRQDGFGFIVGDRANRLLVVTANHVVRGGSGPSSRTTGVTIAFYEDQGRTYPAELLQTVDHTNDLAVLEVPSPVGARWRRNVLATDAPVRGQQVWYVGRDRTWYVPTISGRVNQLTLDSRILIDGLNLQVGTSGAPLISDRGIIGLLIEDSPGAYSKAVPIEILRRAFQIWNLPWALTPADPPAGGRAPGPPSRPPVIASGDFGDFSLAVDEITIGPGMNPVVTLFVTYYNKTADELLLGLCDPQNSQTTILVDDLADRYLLERSFGISEVCNNRSPSPLVLPPRASARVSLAFDRHAAKNEMGSSFSLSSDHAVLLRDPNGRHRVKSRHIISFLQMAAGKMASVTSPSQPPPPPRTTPPSPPSPRITADRGDFSFEADGCRRSRGTVTCSVLVTSHAKARKLINLCSSYAVDNLSNKYESQQGTRVAFGSGRCGGDVESELPVRFGITVPGMNPGATALNIVFADGSAGSFVGSVILRNIRIVDQ